MGKHIRAFTLVELLIVMAMLAIVAMIATKRFSSALDDARQVSSDTDETALQRIVGVYAAQHGGRGPHLDFKGQPDYAQTVSRLTSRTDRLGKVTADGPLGPYVRQWPANPVCAAAVAQEIEFGTATDPPRSGKTGWYYNTDTSRIYLNTPKAEGDEKPVTPVGPATIEKIEKTEKDDKAEKDVKPGK